MVEFPQMGGVRVAPTQPLAPVTAETVIASAASLDMVPVELAPALAPAEVVQSTEQDATQVPESSVSTGGLLYALRPSGRVLGW